MFISKARYKGIQELNHNIWALNQRILENSDLIMALNKSLSTENKRLRAEIASYKSSEITAGAIRQSVDAADKPDDLGSSGTTE